MIILSGAPSLSDFRRRKLLSSLQKRVPSVESVAAEHVHFAEVSEPLSDADQTTLKALMTYGPEARPVEPPFSHRIALPWFEFTELVSSLANSSSEVEVEGGAGSTCSAIFFSR